MGVTKETVQIMIYEAPKSNWTTGGKLHSEKHIQTTFTMILLCSLCSR